MSTECSTKRKPNAVIQGMARHPNLFAFIIAVIVAVIANYGDSSSSKPVELPPKQPSFWFSPHHSIVLDSPRGSLLPIVNRLSRDELVFVMFYAPWCSRSVKAKSEFEKAAAMLQGKVTFAAVNCWWPEGECSKQYKFLMYPAFLAYHTTLDGYKFVGVTRADYMVKFVESLLNPVSLVSSIAQVRELIARHDYVVFGYFDIMDSNQIGSYRQFYYASMRILEKDPLQPIHFAVISNPFVAQGIHLKVYTDIIMGGININSTMFPLKNNITSTNLIAWALRTKGSPVVKRLAPLGSKSRFVFDEMNKGPALILFHPENVLFSAEPSLRLMKDVALQYKACDLSVAYQDLHQVWKRIAKDNIVRYKTVLKMCRLIRKSKFLLRSFPCCSSVFVKSINRDSLICDVCKKSTHEQCHISSDQISHALSHIPAVETCHTTASTYTHGDEFNMCCHNSSRYELDVTQWVKYNHDLLHGTTQEALKAAEASEASGGRNSGERRRLTDRFYSTHLEYLPRKLCSRVTSQSPVLDSAALNADEVVHPLLRKHFAEEGCRYNGSLNFYSMDSRSHWMFSERFGMSQQTPATPGVVIFDKDNEEHYIMKENLTMSNTMSFILRFQQGSLQRHTNSHSARTGDCVEESADGSICVRELDAGNFLDVVKEESKDVVVLIYAHWCGFCQTLSHTFLTLARYFSTSQYISFVRINGAKNDLPWEYTVDSYPTILFFPAQRKADSVMFPPWKEKSLTNLLHFVLHHTTFDTKLLLAADVCSKSCIQTNLKRSSALLHKLKGKYARTHVQALNALSYLTEDYDRSYFFRLSYEYLSKHLMKLNEKMKSVRKLIGYLRKSKNGAIDKHEFMSLFGVRV